MSHVGTRRSQRAPCTSTSAPKADLHSLESEPIRADSSEEGFTSPPLFVLDGVFFDGIAAGQRLFLMRPKLNKNKDKVLEMMVMKLGELLVSISNNLLAPNLNRNNNLKGKIIELNRQPNWRNETFDEGQLGEK